MLYLIIIAIVLFKWLFPKTPKNVLNVYFGVPGSGKTTFAAYLAKQCNKESWVIKFAKKYPCKWFHSKILNSGLWKRKLPVYSNVPITGSYVLEPFKDIGKHMIVRAKVIIDEAGIEYNNRKTKEFPTEAIYWYKYHRHYECSVDVFSQSHEDMDITLRRLAQNFFVVKKSLIPYFIVVKRIRRKIGIDKMTHQIIDQYYFGLPIISSKWVFCPPLWKLFNSFSRRELLEKKWKIW